MKREMIDGMGMKWEKKREEMKESDSVCVCVCSIWEGEWWRVCQCACFVWERCFRENVFSL